MAQTPAAWWPRLRFYDCFTPLVSIDITSEPVAAGAEFMMTLAPVGAKAGCTTSATLTVVAGGLVAHQQAADGGAGSPGREVFTPGYRARQPGWWAWPPTTRCASMT